MSVKIRIAITFIYFQNPAGMLKDSRLKISILILLLSKTLQKTRIKKIKT